MEGIKTICSSFGNDYDTLKLTEDDRQRVGRREGLIVQALKRREAQGPTEQQGLIPDERLNARSPKRVGR